MKRTVYLITLLRSTAVLLACGLPVLASAAPAFAGPPVLAHPRADVPVSGRVTGPDGTGLPGVTVLVQGTSTGTTTNSDGVFTLNVPEGSKLLFSFVGYATQTVAVTAGMPALAGQQYEFLELQMILLREGLRDVPVMNGMLKAFSDQERHPEAR